jgi:hypothetical protein
VWTIDCCRVLITGVGKPPPEPGAICIYKHHEYYEQGWPPAATVQVKPPAADCKPGSHLRHY